MTEIILETRIEAPLQRCFDLARDVELHTRSMSHTGERAVGGITTGLMGLGDEVTWEARHLGITWRLTSRITELEPAYRFVDVQVRGPFAYFKHIHEFKPIPSGMLMTDEFNYVAPFGWFGVLADKLFLARYMRRLLRTRNAFLKHSAESGTYC